MLPLNPSVSNAWVMFPLYSSNKVKKHGCYQNQRGVADDCVVDLPHKLRNALFDAVVKIRDNSLRASRVSISTAAGRRDRAERWCL